MSEDELMWLSSGEPIDGGPGRIGDRLREIVAAGEGNRARGDTPPPPPVPVADQAAYWRFMREFADAPRRKERGVIARHRDLLVGGKFAYWLRSVGTPGNPGVESSAGVRVRLFRPLYECLARVASRDWALETARSALWDAQMTPDLQAKMRREFERNIGKLNKPHVF